MQIPFSSTENIKPYLSGIDLKFDIQNMDDSFRIAAADLQEIISPTIYQQVITYFNDSTASDSVMDEFVEKVRFALTSNAMYHHFIWLRLRISSNGITTTATKDETRPYKYDLDEAKENLLRRYGTYLNDIIDFLDNNGDTFTSWAESDQKTELSKCLFAGYREFSKYAAISPADAAFYIRATEVIKEIIDEEIEPVTGPIADVDDEKLITKVKRFLAYKTLAIATLRFDIAYLPQPVRADYYTENRTSKGNEKENIHNKYNEIANGYMMKIETHIAAAETDTITDTPKEIDNSYFEDTDKVIGFL